MANRQSSPFIVKIMIVGVFAAAVGLFLIVSNLAEHAARDRLGAEALLFVPLLAALVAVRARSSLTLRRH